jgi:hypothetical protein
MDLRFGEEYELFREELRSFVEEHWHPAVEPRL